MNKAAKGLVVFGLILAGWNLVAGAAILILDYSREIHAQQPLWKFGQYTMFIGIINSSVFGFLLFAWKRIGRGR